MVKNSNEGASEKCRKRSLKLLECKGKELWVWEEEQNKIIQTKNNNKSSSGSVGCIRLCVVGDLGHSHDLIPTGSLGLL